MDSTLEFQCDYKQTMHKVKRAKKKRFFNKR